MRTTLFFLMCGTAAAAQDVPVLTVYTYDSFVADWGPGPAIEEGFEAVCDCDLQFVAAGDGAALFARVQLEGASSEADVVLGIDTNLVAAARDSGLFASHGGVAADYALPIAWEDPVFVPYDWGYFAFVYDSDRGTEPPESLSALAGSDLTVLIQDPRSSTPGLGLLMWTHAVFGDEAPAFWEALSDNIVTVTPGWSEAYGLFLEGEADMVLSYTTSPAYHAIAEGNTAILAAAFDEGHYMQIEVAGRLAASDAPDLAEAFLAYLVTDPAQSVLPTTNWMYPAVMPEAGLPEGFEALIEPAQALHFDPEEAAQLRDGALDTWRAALSR